MGEILFQSENCAGIGVIIRNELRQVMVSLSQRIPLPFIAIEVEVLVARRGLELALETGFGRVIHKSSLKHSKITLTP